MKDKPNGPEGAQVRLDHKSHKLAKAAAKAKGMKLYAWISEAIQMKLRMDKDLSR